MEKRESDVWGEQNFPPWSIKKILFFGVIGVQVFSFLMSFLVGFIIGFTLGWMNVKFSLGLSNQTVVLITTFPSLAVGYVAIIAFVSRQLRNRSFSLRHVWISDRIDFKEIGLSSLLGIFTACVLTGVYKLVTGEFSTPPVSPMQADWRLSLWINLMTLALMAPFMEEIVFRGLLYQALRKRFSASSAAVFSAITFSVFHIDRMINANFLTFIFIFIIGMVLAVQFERSRCLNNCISFHILYNTTMFIIYYVAYVIPA